MSNKILKCLLLLLIVVTSCVNNKITECDMDEFIVKYEFEDFSYFRNYKLAIRQRTLTETIYIIGDSDSNIDSILFFVYVDNYSNEISQIKEGTIKQSLLSKRLTIDKIKKMIFKYKKYNFQYLSVNIDNSVSINPYFVSMEPYFLRIETKSNEKFIKKNYTLFKHYKKNWYVKE